MASLIPVPGTADRPADPGSVVALLSDPLLPGAFGALDGALELDVPGEAAPRSLPISAQWAASVVITTLPTNITADSNPFTIRVVPLVGQPIEAPLLLAEPLVSVPVTPQDLVDDIASKLQLVADVAGETVSGDAIAVQPADQPLPLRLEPLAGSAFQVRSLAQGRQRPAVPRRHLVPLPAAGGNVQETATGAIDLGSLPLDLAGQLAGASATVKVTLTLSGLDVTDVDFELRPDPTRAAFTLLGAPHFAERQVGQPATVRTLSLLASAKVTLTLPDGQTVSSPDTELDALGLQLMPLQLPTMLALFRHADFDPRDDDERFEGQAQGFVLLAVPAASPVPDQAQGIAEVLQGSDLVNAAGDLSQLATRFRALARLTPVIDRLEAFLGAVAGQVRFGVCKGDQGNLNGITMWDRDKVFHNDIEANNEVSSIMLLGLPGTTAKLFCNRHHDAGRGVLTIELPAGGLPLPRLAAIPALPAQPQQSFDGLGLDGTDSVTVTPQSRPGGKDFDNAISSLTLRLPGQ